MKVKDALKKIRIRREDVERSLILCAAAMVVALALQQNLTGREKAASDDGAQLPVTAVTAAPMDTRPTVVYYQSGEGYLVPVTCRVENQDGIAKATLKKLVSSGQNDLAAARLGLLTTIPEGTQIDLDISGGRARVDLSKEALACRDAEAENAMIQSIVETLCQWDTVETVDFLFDGQKRSKLTYGSDVSGAFSGGHVNFESAETVATAGAGTVELYFPSASGRMLVPVTRTVYSASDVTTAMLELCKGPRPDSGLNAPLPPDCGLKGVTMKNGVVTVNFSKEFAQALTGEAGDTALKAVYFTAMQFPGVKDVRLQIDGQDYTPAGDAVSTSLNLDSDIVSYFPGVVETD